MAAWPAKYLHLVPTAFDIFPNYCLREYLPCVAITDALSSPAWQDAVVERLAADPFPDNKLHAEAQVIGPEGQPEGKGQEGRASEGRGQ